MTDCPYSRYRADMDENESNQFKFICFFRSPSSHYQLSCIVSFRCEHGYDQTRIKNTLLRHDSTKQCGWVESHLAHFYDTTQQNSVVELSWVASCTLLRHDSTKQCGWVESHLAHFYDTTQQNSVVELSRILHTSTTRLNKTVWLSWVESHLAHFYDTTQENSVVELSWVASCSVYVYCLDILCTRSRRRRIRVGCGLGHAGCRCWRIYLAVVHRRFPAVSGNTNWRWLHQVVYHYRSSFSYKLFTLQELVYALAMWRSTI